MFCGPLIKTATYCSRSVVHFNYYVHRIFTPCIYQILTVVKLMIISAVTLLWVDRVNPEFYQTKSLQKAFTAMVPKEEVYLKV